MLQKVQTKYTSDMPGSDYDSVTVIVSHGSNERDHIQVLLDNPERWRTSENAIRYLQWVIGEIKKLQPEIRKTQDSPNPN